jgi:hypothetical protein
MRNYIALAVPFFFAFIALELVVARGQRRSVYQLADAVTDLSRGVTVTSQVALALCGAARAAVYAWV